ncbi:hypothetical protein NQ317_008069 [Molorchus minor]|uniref:Uncharacterized protein n=1 Tax=Molorchus minor TaxID=1323400 RepID=A0ABQ9J485_9CUCU|nr:hypothetical protein NQ317_008069 [Molorchus minor]
MLIGFFNEPEILIVSVSDKKPVKSETIYSLFMNWRNKIKINSSLENILFILMSYLRNINPQFLWTHYAILKSPVSGKHKVDIPKYPKLHALLKRRSEGYIYIYPK